jgi:hypothetical protein
MTAVDSTPLAVQIVREHRPWVVTGIYLGCTCGHNATAFDSPDAHIATVTEEAVVERARDAVARMNIVGPMRAIFAAPVFREALDALEVLVDQEIQSALHCIDPGSSGRIQS